MPDELESLMMKQVPTADRPLLGLTVLVVEDSLYACEAMRLLCLRSGARIRRADSLKSAHRHLSVYRPVVVIVDLGLPDGSGAELINELAIQAPRVAVILGISGDTDGEEVAIAAGADGFLEKPFDFQTLEQLMNKCLKKKKKRNEGEIDGIALHSLQRRKNEEVALMSRFYGGLLRKHSQRTHVTEMVAFVFH